MNPLLLQFQTEARELLEQIGHNLLALEQAPDDAALVSELFRLVHTLKGNAGLFEFMFLTRVVHAVEDLLDQVRDGELAVEAALIDDLLSAMDYVLRLLDQIEATGRVPASFDDEGAQLVARLRARSSQDAGAETQIHGTPPPADLSWLSRLSEDSRAAAFAAAHPRGELHAVRYLPDPECFFKGEDPLQLLRSLPQRLGFTIQATAPWPPLAELDVFRCNLLIDALSGTGREIVAAHFRAMPEQIALYRLPAYALALPDGDPHSGPPVHEDFTDWVHCLASDDRAELRTAIVAQQQAIAAQSWLASALRWSTRLLDAGAPEEVLRLLLRAISNRSQPDWQSLVEPEAPAVAAVPAGHPTARASHVPAPQLTAADDAMWWQIFATQRRLLDLPTPPAQWAGRLGALHHTLVSLFHVRGDTTRLAALEAAVRDARHVRSFTPLAEFLDGAAAPNASPIVAPLRIASALPPSAAAKSTTPAAPLAQERSAVEEPKYGRRAEDIASDKSARILKVPQEKIDRMMDLIGEMVVAKNALPYLAARAEDVFGSPELSREIRTQYAIINRIAEELQDGIVQVRMLPVGAVFQRFTRLVRDVSKQLGKKVRLTVEGEETEADKNIVEALADPLIHILRNSLDHGLEMPDVRIAAGKPEEGNLTVRASHEGDRVLIQITDDGKGIDPEVVKRKAFEKGLIDEHRLETITDAEAVQLVFAAGFSTVEVVSDLSGRGVGMDVVMSSLDKIGGRVQLTSEKGRGTCVVLRLPKSMTVSKVMMVDVGGQRFGVPMDVVVETVRIPQSEVQMLKNRRATVRRGQLVPLFGAGELLKIAVPPLADAELAVLVARLDGETVGIIVDGFAQTIDVFLKSLEGPLADVTGFSGTALLGDGSVLLVLNLKELF